jgi:hypothetical protein
MERKRNCNRKEKQSKNFSFYSLSKINNNRVCKYSRVFPRMANAAALCGGGLALVGVRADGRVGS